MSVHVAPIPACSYSHLCIIYDLIPSVGEVYKLSHSYLRLNKATCSSVQLHVASVVQVSVGYTAMYMYGT